ncbi:sigma factor-like helix-turn-helix DNA-binding protein [Mucilaginibacter jinjuensis]|uniref:Sigma factor-like helix-turn-helix DNA-binding protein n=1 Tax=Mucilaginibacter jinjuensis TaxID=1176721 RepID=A0ABY7T650_9SPHI|nr:sigma factor-like helix-turn-helix DNA-binding protein [Mucilaginibacter jinjuensis]WCT11851.1 sigma factor-like helix-turn-helix DNA-binding protein [Mucilaginibacter jinjuensis]
MEPQRQIILKQAPYSLHDLYDRYAGMLLGYLSEAVKDRKLAEQHLVNIFNIIPQHLDELNTADTNTWCQLQRLAKKHLTGSSVKETGGHEVGNGIIIEKGRNKFLDQMSNEQQTVFCAVYYNHKTIMQLADELNKPEELIRKALREAFAIIRKGT